MPDEDGAQRRGEVARIRIGDAERTAVLRHLLQELADQIRIRGVLRDPRPIQHVSAAGAPVAAEPILDVGLEPADAGAAEILALRPVGHADQRDVRDRVLHPIVEPGGSNRQVLDRGEVQPQLAAHQTLGAELIVGQRHQRANAELAVQLVQCRGAETGADAAPGGDPVGDVIQRRQARAEHRVIPVGEIAAVRRGRKARRHARLVVMRLEVAPVIDAAAHRDRQCLHRPELALHERAAADLRAAGLAQRDHRGARRRIEHALLALAFDPPEVGARRQQMPRRQCLGPQRVAADAGRRHVLEQRHPADRARRQGRRRRGRHRHEVAVEALPVEEQRRLQVALIRERGAHAGARRLPQRVVRLRNAGVADRDRRHLGVVAFLAEVAGAHERADAVGGAVVDLHAEVAVLDLRLGVDEPALGGDHLREPAGVEEAPLERDSRPAPHVAAEEIQLPGVARPRLRPHLEGARPGPRADDVDHAAEGVVAPDARARPVDQLDALDAFQRDARPVHPSPERIVERHAVNQHQRPAHPARSDPAQRHALRRRMRGQAAGAAEQAEGRRQPQHVVGDHRGRAPDRFLVDHVHAGGNVPEPLLGPRRSDGHRFEQRRRLQDDLDRTAGRRRLAVLGKASGAYHQGRPRGIPLLSSKRPSDPVTACCSIPFASRSSTAAPETTPPDSSRTTPVTADWANTTAGRAR